MEGRSLTMDRISDLPDQILTKILSFLPAEEVVSTWLLSKRWTRVWASVPVLVFNNSGLTEQRKAKFLSYVKGMLDRRDNLTLDMFQLTWSCDSDVLPRGYEILSHAVLLMPRVLSIYMYTNGYLKLSSSIFICPSVEEMSLEILWEDYKHGLIEAESKIDLPRLKKLQLSMAMINNDFITTLLSGCPVLEELNFTGCSFEINEISSPVLKKLTIDTCCLFRGMEISCPSVTSLNISSLGSMPIRLKNMASLLTVNFDWDQDDDDDDDCDNFKILSGISNVANLTLNTTCFDTLDLLAADFPNCPTFNNLKRLKLGELDINLHWNLVVCLLQHSPNLKTLTLQLPNRITIDSEEESEEDLEDELLEEESKEELPVEESQEELLEEESEEELPEDLLVLEYLETVEIECPRKNAKLAKKVVRYLSATVKFIGKVIIK